MSNDRLNAIRERLEAAAPFGNKFDSEIIEADEYEPAVAKLWAHAPEDIAWLLERVGELEKHAVASACCHDNMVAAVQSKARIAALEKRNADIQIAFQEHVDHHQSVIHNWCERWNGLQAENKRLSIERAAEEIRGVAADRRVAELERELAALSHSERADR